MTRREPSRERAASDYLAAIGRDLARLAMPVPALAAFPYVVALPVVVRDLHR